MSNAKAEAVDAHRRGDLSGAERLYRELLRSSPSDAELHYYMGLLCHQAGRTTESAQSLQTAFELAPGSLVTLKLLVRVCNETGDAQNALIALDRYLAQRPDDAGMLNAKGQQLTHLGRLQDAEQAFRRAAERSGNAAMFHDLGLCRQLAGNLSGAIEAYQEAIQRGHNHPKTRLWLAQCLRGTGRTKDYYEIATDAAQAVPNDIELLIEAQSARRYVCDWDGFDQHQPQLQADLRQVLETSGEQVIPPGILNYLEIDERTISAAAKRYAEQLCVAGGALHRKPHRHRTRDKGRKIKLGYLSTDFFAHAVGSLVRNLFACHDRARFEVYGYSLRHQPDAIQSCIQQGCQKYRNLSASSAQDIARVIAEDEIDILIDLAGYTSAAQPSVLASRPAPVQVSWLGYLGTCGGEFIDYIIADDKVLPPEVARNYSERIIRMPCFLVTSPLPMAEHYPSREEAGLGKQKCIFCSFNQPYKLDRNAFAAWMEILRRVPDSQLWMYAPDTEVCTENLRREATRLDVDPARLVFAQREPMADHVARMKLADLALDPFHISGGATTVANLAAGVPVLTLRGNSFLARMGSSINTYLGMDDLDCVTPAEYIEKAVELGTNPSRLIALKSRLWRSTRMSGFFDTQRMVNNLEEALQMIWDRHVTDLAPDDVKVPA